MKQVKIILSILIVFILSSCGGVSEKYYLEDNQNVYYVLNSSGRFDYYTLNYSINGTYKKTDNIITLKINPDSITNSMIRAGYFSSPNLPAWSGEINGNILNINGEKFYLKKD